MKHGFRPRLTPEWWPEVTELWGDEDDYYIEDDEPDELEMALSECGKSPMYLGCLKAGSEECEFDCPFRNVDLFSDDEVSS